MVPGGGTGEAERAGDEGAAKDGRAVEARRSEFVT